MADEEEGMGWESQFAKSYGSEGKIAARLKAERAANMTEAERGRHRRGPPKRQTNFRATTETRALLDALCAHLTQVEGRNVGQGDVIERALSLLARSLPGCKGPQ